jgi:hypothetical protein
LFAANPSLVILDTTLTGPTFPMSRMLEPLSGETAPVVINVRSGLKLDQAGLELVNVGILSVYTHIATRASLFADIAASLRHLRTVLGLGLTLDEISTLEAPWFLAAFARAQPGSIRSQRAGGRCDGEKQSPLLADIAPAIRSSGPGMGACALLHRAPSRCRSENLSPLGGDTRRRSAQSSHPVRSRR